ncbi:SGNH/GDSL hydrolase family protein [Herbiconiux sp. CPCC 205763]|uniref:SGNH/GDSL hydrolase family protein n=1 Tax=Herbiconiux aconitum TaxID=2970913 RepID=A0ABT2GKQ7_9MICO|nr:SGNH/GDSL hydrolase family protein [Herbiconiux aconitum]MCS5716802.1 SGNH/GDSL hydrolase family protein [Herbiconiux aconitum]
MHAPTRRIAAFSAAVFGCAALIGTMVGLSAVATTTSETAQGPIDPDAPVAAFYGDSYTLGTGASHPSKRWSTLISVERGWTEFNPSVNGLGFVNNRASTPPDYLESDAIPTIVAERPDLVFVTMGLNDNFSMPVRDEAIENAIRIDLRTLRAELPSARIIVVEPFWYSDERPDSVRWIIDRVQENAAVIDADYLPGASRWIEGHPEWMAADGLHPNDDGYAEIARRMDAALDRLGL